MQHPFFGLYSGTTFKVETTEQATLLTKTASFLCLEPFFSGPKGLSEVAREINISPERMSYWVRKFLATNLLVEAGTHSREFGRPIQLYQTATKAFYVPFELTPFFDLEALLHEEFDTYDDLRAKSLASLLTKAGLSGEIIYFDEGLKKVVNHTAIPDNSIDTLLQVGQRAFHTIGIIEMTDEDARWLREQLHLIRQKVIEASRKPDPKRRYLVQAILLEVKD
jgi:hypothetical protein